MRCGLDACLAGDTGIGAIEADLLTGPEPPHEGEGLQKGVRWNPIFIEYPLARNQAVTPRFNAPILSRRSRQSALGRSNRSLYLSGLRGVNCFRVSKGLASTFLTVSTS
jgi:hypothetical protein